MIAIQRSEKEPAVLSTTGKTELYALCTRYDSGNTVFKTTDFKAEIYGHESVKTALKTMQHDKCCFCESKISHISYGDVEHFRPKAAYKQSKKDTLSSAGYYWLAYDWNNLLLSCTLCNQRYKANLFPLLDATKRAKNHHENITDETPLFINPALQNPENHIDFHEAIIVAKDEYGQHTIESLGLNRDALKQQRAGKLELIVHLLGFINSVEKYPEALDLQEKAQKARQNLAKHLQPQAEYSAMIKAAITTNCGFKNLIGHE
jgi:uncharacterized protein (TIGR02646 family)